LLDYDIQSVISALLGDSLSELIDIHLYQSLLPVNFPV
jgi:hypothetical protein